MVIPLEYDLAGTVIEYDSEGNSQPGRYRWVNKGNSFGIFENPYYAEKNVGDGFGSLLESPFANRDNGESTAKSDKGDDKDNTDTDDNKSNAKMGGQFPIIPVVAAAIVVVVATIVIIVLVQKKKKATLASGYKFCPNCGKPLTGVSKFCSVCGYPLTDQN